MRKRTIMALFVAMMMVTACGNTKVEPSVDENESITTPSETGISDADESNYGDEQGDVDEQDDSDIQSDVGEQAGADEGNDMDEQSPSDAAAKEDVPDVNALQQLYAKAYEYEYMALGYYQDPDDPTSVRDGYVPFDENYRQESTEYLKSGAHGVSIRLYMVRANNATDANAECSRIYKEQLEGRGIDAEFYDAMSFDNDTLALGLCTYQNEKDESVTAFLYSDIRDDGTMYMCAEIEMNEAEFDEETPAVVNEIDDAYGMTFSAMFQ